MKILATFTLLATVVLVGPFVLLTTKTTTVEAATTFLASSSSFRHSQRSRWCQHDRDGTTRFKKGLAFIPSQATLRKTSLQQQQQKPEKEGVTNIDLPLNDYWFPSQTPHAGCHFRPTHPSFSAASLPKQLESRFQSLPRKSKRFFEGWYYRVTLPPPLNASFAFIYSIEDPLFKNKKKKNLSLACHQIMGPQDGDYIVESHPDDTKFWAWPRAQGLGCIFEYNNNNDNDYSNTTAVNPNVFDSVVRSGFQMLPHGRLQGKLIGQYDDDVNNADTPSTTRIMHKQKQDGQSSQNRPYFGLQGNCTYDIVIHPETMIGWGGHLDKRHDVSTKLKSTAGWLARFGVFEPHWQVTMADARCSGTITWNTTNNKDNNNNVVETQTYTFDRVPFYAEKNWGGSFPIRWYWTQCNSFVSSSEEDETNPYSQLSVTAGGGTRKLPLTNQMESLGMVCVHYNGTFYEAVPWTGTMDWEIEPWGGWKMKGRCTTKSNDNNLSSPPLFEVELCAKCQTPGTVLQAPTEKDGMVYFCRDSFWAETVLNMWELEWNEATKEYQRSRVIISNATSLQGAVEIGGGPWWNAWNDVSVMKQPLKWLVQLPLRINNRRRRKSKKNK